MNKQLGVQLRTFKENSRPMFAQDNWTRWLGGAWMANWHPIECDSVTLANILMIPSVAVEFLSLQTENVEIH